MMAHTDKLGNLQENTANPKLDLLKRHRYDILS